MCAKCWTNFNPFFSIFSLASFELNYQCYDVFDKFFCFRLIKFLAVFGLTHECMDD